MTRRVTGGIALPWNMGRGQQEEARKLCFPLNVTRQVHGACRIRSGLWKRAMLETVKLVGVLAHRVAHQSCSNSKSLAFPGVKQNQGFERGP